MRLCTELFPGDAPLHLRSTLVQFILFLAHLFIEPDIFIDRHVVYYTLVLTFTNAKFNEMIPVNMKMMSKPIMLKYDSVDL